MPVSIDLVCLATALLFIIGYHWAIFVRVSPGRQTFIQFQDEIRRAWVVAVMSNREAILGVQTLRNSIMGATVFCTTAILLIIGTLTMSIQIGRLGESSLFFSGSGTAASLLQIKTLLLLANLVAAFMFFSQAIRLYAHVGIILGAQSNQHAEHVATRLMNQAARCHFAGMRCYYLAIPLVLWLYDPLLLLASTVVLLLLLYRLDRSPVDAD